MQTQNFKIWLEVCWYKLEFDQVHNVNCTGALIYQEWIKPLSAIEVNEFPYVFQVIGDQVRIERPQIRISNI